MMKIALVCLALSLPSGLVWADEIVQEGSIPGPGTHSIVLDQFDDLGGSRVLNFVWIDLLTSTIGGGTLTGTGVAVNISVALSADYLLGMQTLAETEAVIDLDLLNTGGGAFSVYNTDTEQVLIDQPADLAAWMGSGDITLTGIAEFQIVLTPPNEINFGAGATVRYTVIYDYQDVELVPALQPLGMLALVLALVALGCGGLRPRA
jgi:hypothetical protein